MYSQCGVTAAHQNQIFGVYFAKNWSMFTRIRLESRRVSCFVWSFILIEPQLYPLKPV